jgi:hypothetical protein
MVAETGTKATATGRRPSMFRRIFVYCWSAKGQNASYWDAAVELVKELVCDYSLGCGFFSYFLPSHPEKGGAFPIDSVNFVRVLGWWWRTNSSTLAVMQLRVCICKIAENVATVFIHIGVL